MKKVFPLIFIVLIFSCQKNSNSLSSINNSVIYSKQTNETSKIRFVLIGHEKWMVSNLDVTHYRNGDVIPQAKSDSLWETNSKDTTGAWCWYNNDSATGAVYGRLYNWYAVNDPRGLAPEGWHVASDSEWNKLSRYYGGNDVSGSALKEKGTLHWLTPNTGATNISGFTALPGGNRFGSFSAIGEDGYWWSSSPAANPRSRLRAISYQMSYITSNLYKNVYPRNAGFSIRCVKDKN